MKLVDVVNYLDEYLKVMEIADSSLNGLVIENSGEVNKIGFAVDFSKRAIEEAVKNNVDMLIVHHGPYWGKVVPLSGYFYKRMKEMMNNDIALYAVHLPLDIHPEVGNNAYAMKLLGLKDTEEFGDYHGIKLGRKFKFKKPMKREEFKKLLEEKLGGEAILWDFGKEEIQTGAYVSGDAISLLEEAIKEGVDIYITGEPKHSAYWIAAENEINVMFLGHYTSERVGLLALKEHLEKKFKIDTIFIEAPTGY